MMADPISLTAAAAGFIGLAGQLAQGVIKLKEIYATIKDAPRDVADLCTKMESLQGVLEEVGVQVQELSRRDIKIDTRTLRDVIAQCETSRYRVETNVKKLGESFRGNRAATVRYVLKKKEIQEMLSDVETCKLSLIIARQSIDGAISSYRHQAILEQHATLSSDNHQILQQTSRVETIVEDVSSQQRLDFDTISQQVAMASERSTHGYRSLQDAQRASSSRISESLRDLKSQLHSQYDGDSSKAMLARIEDIQRDIHASNTHLEHLVSRRADESHLSSTVSTKRLKVGFQSILFNFSVEFSSEQGSQQAKDNTVAKPLKKRVCTLRLPTWFVQNQYNFALARSKNGWLFHPSMYRTVPYGSPFFEACTSGDLETMKMLLTTKQAYLGDRAVMPGTSYSALGWTLACRQFEASKFLVDAGILSFFQSRDYTDALGSFALNWTSPSNRKENREVLRLITPKQHIDPDWIDDIELGSNYYKAIQDLRFYAEEASGSALDRFEALIFPTTLNLYGADLEFELHLLSEFLGEMDHLREIRAAAPRSIWLLFTLADKISKLFERNDFGVPPERAFQDCCLALGTICSTELDLHTGMSKLPKVWSCALCSHHWIPSSFNDITPFAYIFACHVNLYVFEKRSCCHFERLNAAMKLWVYTLHNAGVDLAAYAENEVWKINRILLIAKSKYDFTCRVLHGPEPDDWRIETGPPGEACPAYFWRSIEAAPTGDELAVKVLDLMHRVEYPETVHCDMPGGWGSDWDGLNKSDWIIKGWLAFMEDSKLAQMEFDLERLEAKEFYEVWDLSSVIKYWSNDEGRTRGSECTKYTENSDDSEGSLYEDSECTEGLEDSENLDDSLALDE